MKEGVSYPLILTKKHEIYSDVHSKCINTGGTIGNIKFKAKKSGSSLAARGSASSADFFMYARFLVLSIAFVFIHLVFQSSGRK